MTIDVLPARLEWLAALAEGDARFTERFGVAVEPGWVGFPEALPYAVDAARRCDGDPWGSYLFFDDDTLVGFGGYKGPPASGHVEIGYAVAPARQGRGIATAATAWMIERARDAGVEVVVAPIADPDGGVADDVYRWELRLTR